LGNLLLGRMERVLLSREETRASTAATGEEAEAAATA